MSTSTDELLERTQRREAPAIARLITYLETRRPGFEELADDVWAAGGRARIIGITGSPGSGKSTLTNVLALHLRRAGRSVAIIAVDPSSSVTGGAILGDRIRMSELTGDDGVYMRSLSTRGSLGGVSRATIDAAAVLDAAGFDDVIIETVGVGQAEVDIVGIAHTVVVVSVPGLGDDIQMIKAGLIELADVHVVNKADRAEANRTVSEIRSMLALALSLRPDVVPPDVVETVATSGRGVPELAAAIDAHGQRIAQTGAIAEALRGGARRRVQEVAKELLMDAVQDPRLELGLDDATDAVVARLRSPYTAARSMFDALSNQSQIMEVQT
jgi:LAO/AO transport system kinase